MARWMEVLLIGACGMAAWPASAQDAAPPLTITFENALAMARESGPDALVARAKVGEAEADRVDASIYPKTNPQVSVSAGPYITKDYLFANVTAGLTQTFELGPRNTARMAGVEAAVTRTQAEAESASQRAQHEAGAAFLRALWAAEKLALTTEMSELLDASAKVTERRVAAGDASQLELTGSRAAAARGRSGVKVAKAELQGARGELKAILGIPYSRELVLSGNLRDLDRLDLAALLKKAPRQPELRAVAAEKSEANADLDLGGALGFPDLGLGVSYELQDKDVHAILGLLTLTLPFVDHGQAVTAKAEAKRARAETESRLRLAQVTTRVQAAFGVYRDRADAVAAFENGAVSEYSKGVAMATKSFEAGETTSSELMVHRRELIDAQLDYVDRKLEAAMAALELRAAAGDLP